MRFGSVFSGIEAASVAWKPLGWEAAFFSEIDKFASEVLKYHYPNTPNFGDITKYKDWNIDGKIDLIVGGSPCQAFSVAGLRKGLDDPRGNLSLIYLGFIERVRPRWFVWENVPGVFSSNGGNDFKSFTQGIQEIGYSFAYRVLDAQFFGVPQRRRRVFLVGHIGNDWRPPAAVLFESCSLSRDFKQSREERKETSNSVEESIGNSNSGTDSSNSRRESIIVHGSQDPCVGNLANSVGRNNGLENCFYESSFGGFVEADVGGALTRSGGSLGGGGENVIVDKVGTLTVNDEAKNTHQGVEAGYCLPCHKDDLPKVTPTLLSSGAGVSRTGSTYQEADFYIPSYSIAENSIGRKLDNGPNGIGVQEEKSYTLNCTGVHGIGYCDCDCVRRLTPVECERLQGFPDNYTNIPWRGKEASPDGNRYKTLGNSMAVPCMNWIGRRIQMVQDILDELEKPK